MKSLMLGLAVFWGVPLYLVATFPQHVPCENENQTYQFQETPEPPLADVPNIQPGPVDAATATQNRQAIESGVALPANGVVLLDQALTIKTGMTLNGGSFKNQYYSATFPLNCSAMCYAKEIGYADTYTAFGTSKTITLADPTQAANYPINGPLHLFRYDGYQQPLGQLNTRRTLVAKNGGVLTLSAPVDGRCNRSKWYSIASPIIQDVRAGQLSVSLPSEGHAALFKSGDYVMVTAGADLANADHCEFHRVIGINFVSVQLESPTKRYYRNPVLAKYEPIRDVTIKNMTIEQPIHSGANVLFAKYATNWKIENVTFNGHLAFGGSSNITLVNCTINGDFGINSCHNINLVNCRVSRLALEEGCFDVYASGCTFGGNPNPLVSSVGCERLSFRSCKVDGGWVCLVGDDLTVDDFQIVNSNSTAMMVGNRSSIRRLYTSAGVIFTGQGVVAQNVYGPVTYLGWTDGSNSIGVALDCANVNIKQGVWRP